MVTKEKLDEAIKEAKRFIVKAEKAKETIRNVPSYKWGCKETGAVRRASMDLTRSLVEIRK